MKTILTLMLASVVAVSLVRAQDAPADNFVDVGKMQPAGQKTPDYNVKGVTEKKWKAKEWLEIEVPFTVSRAPKGAEKTKDLKYIGELTFKYYVLIKTGKVRKTLTAEIKHVSIPIKEKMASVVYLSPQSIERILNKSNQTGVQKLVTGMGVEVFHSGTLAGMWSSTGKGAKNAWWKGKDSVTGPKESGMLLPKSKTPFAPLWGDYHAPEG